MTVKDYIEGNNPFYHLTPMNNISSILTNGLLMEKSDTRKGVCVVRTCANDIIYEIIDTMICTMDNSVKYALIKIEPKKHGICEKDITRDPTGEGIAPLCNYICKDIVIDEVDIIRKDIPIGQWRGNESEIVELTDYSTPPPPIVKKREQ